MNIINLRIYVSAVLHLSNWPLDHEMGHSMFPQHRLDVGEPGRRASLWICQSRVCCGKGCRLCLRITWISLLRVRNSRSCCSTAWSETARRPSLYLDILPKHWLQVTEVLYSSTLTTLNFLEIAFFISTTGDRSQPFICSFLDHRFRISLLPCSASCPRFSQIF